MKCRGWRGGNIVGVGPRAPAEKPMSRDLARLFIVSLPSRSVPGCVARAVAAVLRERERATKMKEGDVEMSPADSGEAVRTLFPCSCSPIFCITRPICSRFGSPLDDSSSRDRCPSWIHSRVWMTQELDDMKKRLKEMEDEAAALREMQAKVEREMGSVQGSSFRPFPFMGLWSLGSLCDSRVFNMCHSSHGSGSNGERVL